MVRFWAHNQEKKKHIKHHCWRSAELHTITRLEKQVQIFFRHLIFNITSSLDSSMSVFLYKQKQQYSLCERCESTNSYLLHNWPASLLHHWLHESNTTWLKSIRWISDRRITDKSFTHTCEDVWEYYCVRYMENIVTSKVHSSDRWRVFIQSLKYTIIFINIQHMN